MRDRKGESRRERRWKGEQPGGVWIKNQFLQDDKCSVMFQCIYTTSDNNNEASW